MAKYEFKTNPYDHQKEALALSWKTPHFAYFMEMGTGKSKVIIDNFCLLLEREKVDAVIIFAPKGVYENWMTKEIPEHAPERIPLNVVLWEPKETKAKKAELNSLFDPELGWPVLIMNIEALSTKKGTTFALKFAKKFKTFVAVDESTTIKNHKAKRTKAAFKIRDASSVRRIATGSPITKSPMDLFGQMAFLDEEILQQSSFFAFQQRYAKMVRRTMGTHSFHQVVGFQRLDELNELISPYSYRKRKEECLDLPEKIYAPPRKVELLPEQKKAYSEMKELFLAMLNTGELATAQSTLTQIMRLQQICSGHLKTDDGKIIRFPSAKIGELMAILEENQGNVLIWTPFVDDIQRITEEIAKVYGTESVQGYYGETKNRSEIVTNFQDPNHPLQFFVGNPAVGGRGLTMVSSNLTVYYANSFDLEFRMQSEDRTHRIGQVRSPVYIDIVAKETVDEKILQALRSKMDIASAILKEDLYKWVI